jgi:hypothetical protein
MGFYCLEVEKAKAGQNGSCGNSRWWYKTERSYNKESILIQIGIESIHVQYTSARLK